MAISRRKWMGTMIAAGGAALLPLRLLANTEAAFKAKDADTVINELFGDTPIEQSADIKLKIPDIAENGAVVPVTVSTDIADVQAISIVVDANPNPLSASFKISPDAFADVSTRVKMGKSSVVRAFVQTPGKVYTTTKEVKVTIGGCGG